MDMGIVNAGQLDVYDAIDPELREACEDVILDRRDDSDRAADHARRNVQRAPTEAEEKKLAEWRSLPVGERLSYALVKGIDAHHRRRHRGSAPASPVSGGRPIEVIEGR